jgi:hypothetical protein
VLLEIQDRVVREIEASVGSMPVVVLDELVEGHTFVTRRQP